MLLRCFLIDLTIVGRKLALGAVNRIYTLTALSATSIYTKPQAIRSKIEKIDEQLELAPVDNCQPKGLPVILNRLKLLRFPGRVKVVTQS